MKMRYFFFLIIVIFASCRPDPIPGPQGPEGPAGPPGPSAFLFETPFFNFKQDEAFVWPFPENFETLPTDVVMVYLLMDENPDVWAPLPRTRIVEGDIISYSFDHTMNDVAITMSATNPELFNDTNITNNWIARIVVIDAFVPELTAEQSLDLKDYDAVMKKFKLMDNPQKINPQLRFSPAK